MELDSDNLILIITSLLGSVFILIKYVHFLVEKYQESKTKELIKNETKDICCKVEKMENDLAEQKGHQETIKKLFEDLKQDFNKEISRLGDRLDSFLLALTNVKTNQ